MQQRGEKSDHDKVPLQANVMMGDNLTYDAMHRVRNRLKWASYLEAFVTLDMREARLFFGAL